MNEYFGVPIEFDKDKVDDIVKNAISSDQKGYVCAVDRNVVAVASADIGYNHALNQSLVNICDGNYVAKAINYVYNSNYVVYTAAELFLKYIIERKYRQYFIGNTQDVLNGLRRNLSKIDSSINDMQFKSLPFNEVQSFDYQMISAEINDFSPDIIWVSLGAPKQEIFMNMLLPNLKKGVMFGVGAVFNFNSGIKGKNRAPKIFLDLQIEWLYRMFQEPRKNFKRNYDFIKILPSLIFKEKEKLKNNIIL